MKPLSRSYNWIKSSLIVLAILGVFSIALNIYLFASNNRLKDSNNEFARQDNSCSMDIIREKSDAGEFVKPLLLADVNSESDRFVSLKAELNSIIQQRKQSGEIQAVSVYLRDLNSSSWTIIGDDMEYYPGSLMKVPIMIYYLKMEQDKPGTLKKEFLYEKPALEFPEQHILGDSIKPGNRYSVAQLLRYMITESDNNATVVLASHIDRETYRSLFADLNIPFNEKGNLTYTISPRQYSKFFRVLYSTTYLSEDLSNYALKLLSECRFQSGLVKDLPTGTLVAHKFGERGFDKNIMDFSECGIIYYKSQPYLLTIMTRGKNIKQQTSLVRELSAEIFNQYKNI